MRITKLTLLGFQLNSALDSGKYNDITIKEVGIHLEQETIFEFLQERLDDNLDLSLHSLDEKQELAKEWQDLYFAVNASKKFGVQKNGLCLIIAYIFEGIQRRQDNNPRVN